MVTKLLVTFFEVNYLCPANKPFNQKLKYKGREVRHSKVNSKTGTMKLFMLSLQLYSMRKGKELYTRIWQK